MSYCHRTALWIFLDAMPSIIDSLLTFHWCLFLGCGNERVICLFRYIAHQFIHFGRIWQCRALIAKCVRLKIVDHLVTHTLITLKQHLYTQYLWGTNHMDIIGIHYCVCMYYRLHAGVLLPFNFWSTTIHTTWVRDGVARSHSRAFVRHFMACRSFH